MNSSYSGPGERGNGTHCSFQQEVVHNLRPASGLCEPCQKLPKPLDIVTDGEPYARKIGSKNAIVSSMHVLGLRQELLSWHYPLIESN